MSNHSHSANQSANQSATQSANLAAPPARDLAYDVAIIGAGLAGQAAALALSALPLRIALISGPAPTADGRTVALMPEALTMLTKLGLGQLLETAGAPLIRLRLIDDSGSLFRPPSVLFHARELGLDAFAINIENHRLHAGLQEKIKDTARIAVFEDRLEQTRCEGTERLITLASGRSLTTRLLVAADGRSSPTRSALNIGTTVQSYDQVALTALFEHQRPHENCSTEFHTRSGPFTLVPLPGQMSSLVWLTAPAQGQKLHDLQNDAFSEACEQQAQSILGRMQLKSRRSLVPMARMQVERLMADRAVLIGDAAHAFPPIGAQGLNLGLRDADDLFRCLKGQSDVGAPSVCAQYADLRKNDIFLRLQGVDLLNRSLLSPYLPIDFMRGAGLLALSAIRPLRRFIMQQSIKRPHPPQWPQR